MSNLQFVWVASLLVMLVTLPVGALRMVAYRSGEIDHSKTLLLAAAVAVGLGLVALMTLVVTSILLMS